MWESRLSETVLMNVTDIIKPQKKKYKPQKERILKVLFLPPMVDSLVSVSPGLGTISVTDTMCKKVC